ncbi:beta-phosphoglucomutase [Lactobacillus gigeriorum]|uniref:Beta-phosphoglucomutase n=1 Tax=Lactobacillus gigeriorum DSM 23908 = CRBIP 24.85 TaxID=1423751 RepID=I7LGK2_9LACO|nr:beta-phosphoglucomutase [Lactobacillus gigeriorum]KRN11829.1 PTS family maltose glucose porter, IIABC component [Lactobacillus gigeriorum DSM 23908 = CRBIP 24.85]CCI87713.1 PTS family maltose/glucose porter, IIABC component [Lactobacillus gigeriorum DSM 23908 = CRBIP 24.85]
MLKGLIFDLDGVLTNSAKFHLGAWNNLAKELGIDLTADQLDGLRGLSRMDSLELILKDGGQETKYSEAEKEKFAAEKNEKFLEQVETMTPDDILPGIPELLADAKAQGLKMAIASASKNAPKILNKLGIMGEFDAIVDPASLSKGKPDPEIYVKAQELLGFEADEVISFEDAAAGVAAIKAAKQFAVGIGSATLLKDADYLVATTADLKLAEIEAAFNKK